jgi:hypothetical protein
MMRKYIYLFMIITALGIIFAGCDLIEDTGGSSTITYEPRIIRTITTYGDEVEIIISRKSAPRAALTPANGDSYVLRLNGVELSRGTITISADRMFFYPSNNGAIFSAIYNGGSAAANFEDMSIIIYELPTKDGSVAPIPPPGGGGGGGGSTPGGPPAPSTPVWTVSYYTTIRDESWGTIHRSPDSEIRDEHLTNGRIEFTQSKLNSWNGNDPATTITDLNVTIPATAPVTRYVRVTGKKLGVDFDKITLNVNNVNVSSATGIINATDLTTTEGKTWTCIDGSDTLFKHATTFAARDVSTGKWTVTRSGAKLDFVFYLDNKVVGTADGGRLPVITIEMWTATVYRTIGVWGTVQRSTTSEIVEDSIAFTQDTLNNWNAHMGVGPGGSCPTSPGNLCFAGNDGYAPLTRYVEVIGKQLGSSAKAGDFDAVHITINGKMSNNSSGLPGLTIDHTDYNQSFASVGNTYTYFKNPITFASRSTGSWVLSPDISGARIEYLFYKGGRYRPDGTGGELVGTADGGALPVIILR